MDVLNPKALGDKIREVVCTPRAVLFCGAGIGVRVGLPTWKEYVLHLAATCEKHADKTAAQLIRERLEDGDYPGAATIYKTTKRIPSGELLRELAAPFKVQIKPEAIERILPLMRLGPSAVVTTNYDRSLHDAYARISLSAPLPIEIDDKTLVNGALQTDFFVARIHGRAERPETMILDTRDYETLDNKNEYLDFLISLLTQRPCLFLGFSFVDPAINNVLDIYRKQVGPNFPILHTAVLPVTAQGTLGLALRQANIKTLFYDGEDNHKELWRAIGLAAPAKGSPNKQDQELGLSTTMRSSFQRFLAFTYAQIKSRSHQRPVLEIAQDGMIRSLIAAAGKKGIAEDALSQQLRDSLHLTIDQSFEIVHASILRLISDGDIERRKNVVAKSDVEPIPVFDQHMTVLAIAVMDRMSVREGVSPTPQDEEAAKVILESIFIARAWDLAAHYAGSSAGFAADLLTVISTIVHEQQKSYRISDAVAMEHAIGSLLTAPDNKEATLLAELGRSAFAVQLVMSSPRQALFQKYSLPQRVYFDTNVLLPAVTDGHPLRPAYADTISRLRDASRKLGNQCELCVGQQFLNEIIAHREIAIEMIREFGLEDKKALSKHIDLYGATNTNIFVGAYSSHVGRIGSQRLSFGTFLQRVAPYKSENELVQFLKTHGFTTVNMGFHAVFASIFGNLLEDNAKDRSAVHPKEKILIQHEAQQLAQLQVDSSQRLRTVFISADHKLQRLLANDPRLRPLSGGVLSQLSFLGLVDIMVGLDVDKRSFVRVIWGSGRMDSKRLLRDYLIKRALEDYDTGMAMAMPEVVDRIAEEGAGEARRKNIDLFSASSAEDVAKTTKFMDRMEDGFFALMREAIAREKKD